MDIFDDIEFVECETCGGDGKEDCCRGHMCPGTTTCSGCNGKGVKLSEKDRFKKNILMKLLEYR